MFTLWKTKADASEVAELRRRIESAEHYLREMASICVEIVNGASDIHANQRRILQLLSERPTPDPGDWWKG